MVVQFDEDKQKKRVEELRLKEEEDLAKLLSERYALPYADLSRVSINTDALKLIPEAGAKAGSLAAFDLIGKRVRVGMLSPKKEAAERELKALAEAGYKPELFVVSEESLRKALGRYSEVSFSTEISGGVLDISDKELRDNVAKVKTLKDVARLVEEAVVSQKSFRISRAFEIVLAGAIAVEASDVHFEPEEGGGVRLRYRLDGVLADVTSVDEKTYKLLLSRIKLVSGLKLNVKDSPQDGRFSIKMPGNREEKEMEIRTSSLPGSYNESIVLRLLNPETIAVPLEELGLNSAILKVLLEDIQKPNGLVLTTGPTGSGKTTTLYACLKKINKPGVKIITIEDPVEYRLEGIVQTQVKGREYTFAEGLRSALRQDPDIIMVGEIRDSETAEIALNASLTGHLVLSTLHTNSAAGSFPRLIDLGVNPRIISSALNLSLAQRLVRKLCQECKKEAPLSGEAKEIVFKILEKSQGRATPLQKEKMWLPGSCEKCGGLGYKGRIGIFEAIRVTKEVDLAIQSGLSEQEIQEAASAQNLPTMKEDGVMKLLSGITSLEELERVINLK